MIIKKWNGSAWVAEYPEVDVDSIVATGTPSSTTFLRGDGAWAVPSGVDNYVNITGDTMTGNLSIENPGPNLTLKDTTDSDDISFHFKNNADTVVGAITTAGNQLNIITSFTNGLELDADKTIISGGNVGIGTTSPSQKLQVEGNINADELHLNDTNTIIKEGGGNSVRIQTNSGNIDIGPHNTAWAHFYTDRPRFYFGKGVDVDGDIRPYSNNTTKIQESTGYIFELGNRVLTTASEGSGNGLDADTVDTKHASDFAKRIDLSSQVQTTSYRKSVIALCNLDNSNTSRDSWSGGTIYFHRTNGLVAPVTLQITMEKRYNAQGANYTALVMSGDSYGDNIQYVQFDYNGTPYGGIEFYFSAAEHHKVYFIGESNFDIFGLDYYNTQTSTVLNSEVNNSISTSNMVAETDLFYNGSRIWTSSTDGSGSGLDADTLDGIGSTSFVRSDTSDTMSGDYRIESGSFASLILDREGATGGGSIVQFENNNGIIGGIGANGDDGLQFRTKDGTQMVIDASNNVGIGTTSPTAKLDVQQGYYFSLITGADVNASTLTNNSRKFTRIGMPHYTNTQEPVSIISGDSDGTDNIVHIGGGTSAGNAATQIHLKTSSNATTTIGTTRLFVGSNGNVGIGTTSPAYKLDVAGTGRFLSDSSTQRVLYLKQNTAGTGNIIQFQGASSENVWEITGRDSNFYIYNNDLSKRAIYIEDSTNYIGINNNTTPSHALDVIGNIRTSSSLIAGANLYLNDDNTAGNSYVFFGDAASDNAHYLQFSDATQKFTLTDDLIVTGDVTVNGSFTMVDTNTSTTEQWSVTNDGTGPAVIINQKGAQPIMDVQDDGTTAFYIEDGGNVGIKTTNPTTTLQVAGRALANTLSTTTANTRDKIRLWDTSNQYTIGMQSNYSFGGLNNDYAMTFQFNNDNDRGFWWGDEAHSQSQGAMALTTNGLLTVASGARIGYGESDTTAPVSGVINLKTNGSTPDSTTATYEKGLTIVGGNQRLNIDVSNVTNGGAYIQSRHESTTYPTSEYTLALNPQGGNVTINGNTAWHSGNDGSGSGLDADLLDGQHASAFAASSHSHGNLTSTGGLGATTTAPASGDRLVIADTSQSNKLVQSNISFGTSTSSFLRNDGTWAEPGGGSGGYEPEWEYVTKVTGASQMTYSSMTPATYEYKFVVEVQTTAEDTSNPYIRINNESTQEYSYQYQSVTQTAETTETVLNQGDALTSLIYTGADLSSYSSGGTSASTIHRAEFIYSVSPYTTSPGAYTATIRGWAHTHYVSQSGTSYDGMVQSTFVGTRDNLFFTEHERLDYIHDINAGGTDYHEMRVYRRPRK